MFFFLFGVLLGVFVYYKLIKPCTYWKDKGVPHLKSWPLVGSMGNVVLKKVHFMDVAVDLYNKYPDQRYAGYMQFTKKFLLIRDVELIKKVGVKNFNHFQDHNPFAESESDILMSKSLIGLNGEKWRDMRATLSPAFTSSKMKNMFTLIAECAETFVNHFNKEIEIEAKDIFSKFTNDVIASTAFGIKIDSLEDLDNEFFKMGTKLTNFTLWQMIKSMLSQLSKPASDFFGIQIFPRHVTNFFRTIVKDNIRKREEEGIIRPDLIHLLMEARRGELKEEPSAQLEGFATDEPQVDPISKTVDLTDDHIVAQAMLFFFAGFDTVSTGLSFMAYELAVNPDVQRKLQEEIDGVYKKCQGKISYDCLLSMKYLDQVLSEALRLWPPAFEIDRLCTKNYVIQPERVEERQFVVEKGVAICLPIMALHRDPQYFPEPERFDPERFNEENKKKILPGTYLPFGIGPRNCIGSRFAILEMKTLFFYLLLKFDIVPVGKTQIPLKIATDKFNIAPKNGFWLSLKPRTSF